ncbi:MAG: hypothetical protein AB7Q16_05095 [Vicinamibacterales bacterium]
MTARCWCAVAGFALLAACGGAPAPPPFQPVADVKQLMASVLEPAADVYWDAVGSIVDEKGVMEFSPQSSEEWDSARNSAYVIAESGNLLMMSPRAKDGGEWMALSRALVDVGQKAIRAAESRDKNGVFDVGAEVYDACTACHAKYALELARPGG